MPPPRAPRIIVREGRTAANMTTLFDEISELIDRPLPRDPQPHIEDVERVLTDGYAAALALEAERWRLERRIGEVTSQLGSAGDVDVKMRELSALTERLTTADGDLTHLRSVLETLRAHRAELQVA